MALPGAATGTPVRIISIFRRWSKIIDYLSIQKPGRDLYSLSLVLNFHLCVILIYVMGQSVKLKVISDF
jgi:hypothetical protein